MDQTITRSSHLHCFIFYHLNSSPVHLFHQLSPMFKVDPLFTRTFLLTLPIRDIANVLQRKVFALHEVCWTLARVVEERDHTSGLFDEEVS